MTVGEIFSKLSEHMVEGLMIHSQMSDYYGFLDLEGYQQCHLYHFYCESAGYKKLNEYYLSYYNKLILEKPISNPHIIPETWYNFSKYDVNAATRKNAIQVGMEKWIAWEKETKTLYEQMYQELIKINEIASALEIGKYINDVSEELCYAEEKLIKLKAIDFDISIIVDNQEDISNQYKEKIKESNYD